MPSGPADGSRAIGPLGALVAAGLGLGLGFAARAFLDLPLTFAIACGPSALCWFGAYKRRDLLHEMNTLAFLGGGVLVLGYYPHPVTGGMLFLGLLGYRLWLAWQDYRS